MKDGYVEMELWAFLGKVDVRCSGTSATVSRAKPEETEEMMKDRVTKVTHTHTRVNSWPLRELYN